MSEPAAGISPQLGKPAFRPALDSGVSKVMILASALIVFSILLIGTLGYVLTERGVVKRLKSRDLVTLAESISAKVDARIDNAVETSLVLAHDPALLEWEEGGERDAKLAKEIFDKTQYLHDRLDYSTTFIVGTKSRHYWDESGSIIDTVTTTDPDDAWYFQSLASRKEVAVNFDYNSVLQDTFAFINTIAGPPDAPLAVVGVGMNLHELSNDFASYKEGKGTNMWLIDGKGSIFLSDDYAYNGKTLGDVMTDSARRQVLERLGKGVQVMEYRNGSGKLMDLISYPLHSTDLHLLVEVERSETVAFLQTIKWNTVVAAVVSIVTIVFIFFYVSRKLANPYKRAVALNQELEAQVAARTAELFERNAEMVDSIGYAKLLQESVLPRESELEELLAGHFVLWRPRDVVGGDFYWTKRIGNTAVVAVGDCTGHGVPGAFMTLLAISSLDRIADSGEAADPASMLGGLNRLVKETLNQEDLHGSGSTDDGLDIGICFVEDGAVTFAGAACTLYRVDGSGLECWKGDRRSIGYRRTPPDYTYANHRIAAGEASYYMTTDGFYDQNGGEFDYSFGRTRFGELLVRIRELPPAEQKAALEKELEAYMDGRRQRDDITVLSFRSGLRQGDAADGGGKR